MKIFINLYFCFVESANFHMLKNYLLSFYNFNLKLMLASPKVTQMLLACIFSKSYLQRR